MSSVAARVSALATGASLTVVTDGVALALPVRLGEPLSVTVRLTAGKALPALTKAAPVLLSNTLPASAPVPRT